MNKLPIQINYYTTQHMQRIHRAGKNLTSTTQRAKLTNQKYIQEMRMVALKSKVQEQCPHEKSCYPTSTTQLLRRAEGDGIATRVLFLGLTFCTGLWLVEVWHMKFHTHPLESSSWKTKDEPSLPHPRNPQPFGCSQGCAEKFSNSLPLSRASDNCNGERILSCSVPSPELLLLAPPPPWIASVSTSVAAQLS